MAPRRPVESWDLLSPRPHCVPRPSRQVHGRCRASSAPRLVCVRLHHRGGCGWLLHLATQLT